MGEVTILLRASYKVIYIVILSLWDFITIEILIEWQGKLNKYRVFWYKIEITKKEKYK